MIFDIINSKAELKEARGSIIIPKTFFENNKEYIVSDIQCSALTRVTSIGFAPDSQISTFKRGIFAGSSIERLSIPKSIDTLEAGWCRDVRFLTKITISPENKHFKYIDNKIIVGKSNPSTDNFDTIFFARRDITSITIPSFIEYILPYSFENCQQLKTINFDSNSKIKILRSESFSKSGIENFICPKSIEKIESFCFIECQKLKTVNFQSGSKLNLIERFAFQYSSLESIFIPKNTRLTPNSLNRCYSLLKIQISPENKYYKYLDDRFIVTESNPNIFDKLVFVRSFGLSKLVIPSYINSFCKECFNLFRCESVEYSTDTKLRSIDDGLFKNSEIKTIKIPSNFTKIGKKSFKSCSKLTTVILDSKSSVLKSIEESSFEKSAIKSLTIPKSVTSIEKLAFYDSDIVSITIPQSTKSIDECCFSNCKKLKTVTFAPDSILESIGPSAFSDSKIESITIPKNVKSIGPFCFVRCSELKTVTFEQNSMLKTIGPSAFESCRIESISIPSSVEEIGGRCFFECYFLKTINFDSKSKLAVINDRIISFTKVSKFSLPPSVTEIKTEAFAFCEKLDVFEIPLNSKLETISPFAFTTDPMETYIYKFSLEKYMKIVSPISFIKKIFTIISEVDYFIDRTFFSKIEIIDENVDLDEIADFSYGVEVISTPNAKEIHIVPDFDNCLFQVPRSAKIKSEIANIIDSIEFIQDLGCTTSL